MSCMNLCGRVECLNVMLVDNKPADWERLKLQMMVGKTDEKKYAEGNRRWKKKTPNTHDSHFGKEEELFLLKKWWTRETVKIQKEFQDTRIRSCLTSGNKKCVTSWEPVARSLRRVKKFCYEECDKGQ